MEVRDRMTLDIFTANEKATLDEVWNLMQSLNIRHMPIVDGDHLVGVVSDRDVYLRALYCNGSIVVPAVPVKEVMSKPVVTCDLSCRVSEIAAVMLEKKIDCLPVLDGGSLVGMITSSDLLEILCTMAVDAQHQTIPVNFRLRSCVHTHLKQ